MIALGWACACAGGPSTAPDRIDADRDGFVAAEDCDDHDPLVHPGAEERCDGFDDDCDGVVEDYVVRFGDADGDGWGDPDDEWILCDGVPPGLADDNLDCDDTDPLVHPNVDEPPCEGVDLNCDGVAASDGWVTVTGGQAWPSLQQALSAMEDGGEAALCPGTHVGPVVVSRAATLRSLAGAESTTIIGDPDEAVVTVSGSLILEGVTLTGGAQGLVVSSGATATVRSSRIVGNDNQDYWYWEASYYWYDYYWYDYYWYYYGYGGDGGGVWADQGATLTLESSEVSDNSAGYGAGVMLFGATARLVDSTVRDNEAGAMGGGIYADASSLELERSTILGNTAFAGGGILLSASDLTLDETSRVAENGADNDGGGVLLVDASLSGGSLEGNEAGSSGGGALLTFGSNIRDVAVRSNIARFGGGVSFQGTEHGADLHLPSCQIEGNVADFGGGLFIHPPFEVDLVLDPTVRLAGNVATLGGGVFFEPIGTVASDGAWWGQLGLDANEPEDIWMDGSYDAEGFATFDCTAEAGELVCVE